MEVEGLPPNPTHTYVSILIDSQAKRACPILRWDVPSLYVVRQVMNDSPVRRSCTYGQIRWTGMAQHMYASINVSAAGTVNSDGVWPLATCITWGADRVYEFCPRPAGILCRCLETREPGACVCVCVCVCDRVSSGRESPTPRCRLLGAGAFKIHM